MLGFKEAFTFLCLCGATFNSLFTAYPDRMKELKL
jgi:hypothetical protein